MLPPVVGGFFVVRLVVVVTVGFFVVLPESKQNCISLLFIYHLFYPPYLRAFDADPILDPVHTSLVEDFSDGSIFRYFACLMLFV